MTDFFYDGSRQWWLWHVSSKMDQDSDDCCKYKMILSSICRDPDIFHWKLPFNWTGLVGSFTLMWVPMMQDERVSNILRISCRHGHSWDRAPLVRIRCRFCEPGRRLLATTEFDDQPMNCLHVAARLPHSMARLYKERPGRSPLTPPPYPDSRMTKFFLLSMPISFRRARNAAVRSRTPLR